VTAPLTVYVYFKVDAGVGDEVVRAALARLDALVAGRGGPMSLMRRLPAPGAADPASAATRRPAATDGRTATDDETAANGAPPETVTWMEVHEAVERATIGRWLQRLEQAAAASGVTALALAGRHVEVFESVDR
jgi:hypothetical protein